MVVFVRVGLFLSRSSVSDEVGSDQTHNLSFYSEEVRVIGFHYAKQR